MLDLSHTPNKVSIRSIWDQPIIERFSNRIGRKLAYFGLPGPDIEDFKAWGNSLGWKTGVEYYPENGKETEKERTTINQLQKSVMLNGYSHEWDLRKGKIEDIILNGYDVDGNTPALLRIENGRSPKMSYDLHNWDFQGGFGYLTKNSDNANRIEAIKKCISLQKGHDFLFLMTFNVRHTLGEELNHYLIDQSKEIGHEETREQLLWYSEQSGKTSTEHLRLKAVIPLFVKRIAEDHSFDCCCYPPVYYEGWHEHMMHYVFELTSTKTVLPCFSQQKLSEVIDLPLISANDGVFSLISEQHPYFSVESAKSLIQSLSLPVIVS